jgi:hypothetical protein
MEPTTGGALVIHERNRQVTEEGFHSEHDQQYINNELTKAAVCYASVPVVRADEPDGEDYIKEVPEGLWPWMPEWWKPGTDMECLIKAGALIIAEIDRRLANGEQVPVKPEAVRG